MENKKKPAEIMREERKKQLLMFIEKKRTRVSYSQLREKSPLKENKNIKLPYLKREEKPKEAETVYINASNRCKKRKEKLSEIYAEKEKLKKQRLLAAQQERQKRVDEKKRREAERIAEKSEVLARRREEKRQKKLEALRLREEAKLKKEQERKARLEREAERKAAAKAQKEAALKRKESLVEESKKQSLKKKEELLSHLASLKEKHNLEYQQKLLQKQLILAERKSAVLRRQEEERQKAEERLRLKQESAGLKEAKKKEALRLREEAKLKKEQERKVRLEREAERKTAAKAQKEAALQQQKLSVEWADKLHLKRKMELLEFIKSRKLLNKQAEERKRILKAVALEKQTVERTEKKKVVPVPVPVPVVPSRLPAGEKPPSAKKEISGIQRAEQKKVSGHIALLVKEAGKIDAVSAKGAVRKSVSSVQKFISDFKKKTVPHREKVPPPRERMVSRYREPFLFWPFVRKNAFKFVFLLLIVGWLVEIFLLMRRIQEPHQRLKMIVGEELFTDITSKQTSVTEEIPETEKLVLSKPERIDIEGKRDPFSPGLLTMNILDKPSPTNIVLAPKPEVISILRPVQIVNVVKTDKRLEPVRTTEVSKPALPSYQTILKGPSSPPMTSSTLTPLERVQVPEPSPLLRSDKRCDLIYRGRMLIEGIEYLFIEGRQKTYRVTVGDVVEGFRILRKENNKLHLSKDGILYEIAID